MSNPYPLHHHELHYYSDNDDAAFVEMLPSWYAVADVLKQHPPGTIAEYGGKSPNYLYMATLNGELVMFETPDHPNTTEEWKDDIWNMFRPDSFEGIGEEEFNTIRADMETWLANPTFGKSASPLAIAQAVSRHHSGADSDPDWVWSGNCPQLKQTTKSSGPRP